MGLAGDKTMTTKTTTSGPERISYTPDHGKLEGVTLTGGVPCLLGKHGICVRFTAPETVFVPVDRYPALRPLVDGYNAAIRARKAELRVATNSSREQRTRALRTGYCYRCQTYCCGSCRA